MPEALAEERGDNDDDDDHDGDGDDGDDEFDEEEEEEEEATVPKTIDELKIRCFRLAEKKEMKRFLKENGLLQGTTRDRGPII